MKGLKQIGKGSFSTVYKKTSNKVLIKSNDKAKECFSHGWGNNSKLFPNIERLDYLESEDKNLYEMKYYPKCIAPKQQLNKKSYERYLLLRNLANNFLVPNMHDGFNKLYELFSNINDKYLKDSLIEAIEGLSNYGSDIAFEISPRNISYTKSGNLILLDCFFFKSDLLKLRK